MTGHPPDDFPVQEQTESSDTPAAEREQTSWQRFGEECRSCRRCGLRDGCRQVVVGRGQPEHAPVLFIGEGPGEQEDIQGEAFVGRAGKLLDLVLDAQLFPKDLYYIANVVKCRPPDNREPTDAEATACLPWLRYQVKAIRPKVIVLLGRVAAMYTLDKNVRITAIRGTWMEKGGLRFMPTYHPSAVLRDMGKREDFYQDLRKVKTWLMDNGWAERF